MTEVKMILSVRFECLSEKKTISKEVELPPVSSVQQIKKYFEDKYDIPVCLQTIRHNSVVLKQDTPVASLRLRHEDELHLTYYAVAECQSVSRVIEWLGDLEDHFEESSIPYSFLDQRVLKDLSFDLFFPWESATKRANRHFFIVNGGLKMLMRLYKVILRFEWTNNDAAIKILEFDMLSALWNLSEAVLFRHAILEEGGLSMCIESLLRVSVNGSEPLEVPSAVPSEEAMLSFLIHETIQRAIGVLTCLCEITSCHMEVASNMAAMTQLSQVIQCPSFDAESVRNGAILCLTLAYSEGTHGYLVEAGLVESVLGSQAQPRQGDDRPENALFQYHAAVFVSQLVLMSPQAVAEKLDNISVLVKSFVNAAILRELTDFEIQRGYLWATFLPYIKLVYQPDTPCCESGILSETQEIALQTIIIALHSMLDREVHRDVLIREGLMDYITCMPWYTTGAAEQRARALVRMVQQAPDVDLQPPSLLNMAKACVAKNFCGLQTVVHLSVPEILQSLFGNE